MREFIGVLLALLAAGCSDGSIAKSTADTKGNGQPEGGGAAEDSGTTEKLEELMAYDWTLPPGREAYYCVFQTLKDDLWVHEYRPLSPTGTHHVSIGYGDPKRPDGAYLTGDDIGGGVECDGLTLGDQLAFGALVGTTGFAMPEGVGVKIAAGKQLLLSVHVLNTGDKALSGRTGVEVVHADPATIRDQAELLLINDVAIQVPPGKTSQVGTCTLDADSTFFGILHHMHRTGAHMTTKAMRANGTATTLLDEDYIFTDQQFHSMEPMLRLARGDQLQVRCDYENPGSRTLTFGESTNDNEMCIALMYRYPASAVSFNCPALP